jgi:hypothetical protein
MHPRQIKLYFVGGITGRKREIFAVFIGCDNMYGLAVEIL